MMSGEVVTDLDAPPVAPGAPLVAPVSDTGPMTRDQLRTHLKAFGVTQAEFAQQLGANVRTVLRWLEEDIAGQCAGVPGAVATTLGAWHSLRCAGLPWHPGDAPMTVDNTQVGRGPVAQRFYWFDIYI